MPLKISDRGQRNILDLPSDPSGDISVQIDGDDNRVTIRNARRVSKLSITISGNGGVVDMDPFRIGSLSIGVKHGGHVLIGKATSIEGAYILCDHGCTVTLGEDCMLSYNVQLRTTDAHGIYAVETGERLNAAEDITISDHVWIGQSVLVSKGVNIGRNSVVGAGSFVQKQSFPPSCILAGTPARLLRTGIVWDRREAEEVCFDDDSMDPLFRKWWDAAHEDMSSS
ncbi:acyltransferase [Salipiger bermudensis]|uniref:acyltransferase n=1 Tax=Salipiger bermudensis TaxID=344736 RepID=UPI003512FFF7